MSKKGLGRSFESLIPSDLLDESFDPTVGDNGKSSELRQIHLNEISTDPSQPRRHFDEKSLKELTESIRTHGVLQPIVVTPKDGGYQIVAGERRFRASKSANLKTIPALVRTLSEQYKLELALIENLQRRDLNAMETAVAYAKLREQFNMSLEEIGATVGGKSASAISNTMRLLKLPKNIQQAIVTGQLTEGQARPLIDADEAMVQSLLPKIIKENWSARLVEQAVKTRNFGAKNLQASTTGKDKSEFVSERLKTSIYVKMTKSGKGQMVIGFKNQVELDRLKKLL